jgi:hypothetical protein
MQVVFPLVLDVYDFCLDEYKKGLEGPRAAWQEAEDRKAGLAKAVKAAARAAANKEEVAAHDSCPSLTMNTPANCFSLHIQGAAMARDVFLRHGISVVWVGLILIPFSVLTPCQHGALVVVWT